MNTERNGDLKRRAVDTCLPTALNGQQGDASSAKSLREIVEWRIMLGRAIEDFLICNKRRLGDTNARFGHR